jgi:hypothetical protein
VTAVAPRGARRKLGWDGVVARLLARNQLLERALRGREVDVVRDVCGIQAQVATAAELAVGVRVEGATQASVRDAVRERRTLVKTYGPRETLHLFPAGELGLWAAARRALGDPWFASADLDDSQAREVFAAVADALDGRELTREELAAAVAERAGEWARPRFASTWADLIATSAYAGVLCYAAPRGAKVTFARPDQWAGGVEDVDPREALDEVVRRYLAAYGPAAHADFARWFSPNHLSVKAARQLLEELGDEVEEVEVEGRRAWMLAADAEVPEEAAEPSVRLLPQYDCYVLGARLARERILPPAAKKRVFSHGRGRWEGAAAVSVLLVDGVVAGLWDRRGTAARTRLRVEPVGALGAEHRRLLAAEADRLGAFWDTDVEVSVGRLDEED